MIIDSHGHLITPTSVFGIATILRASNGQHSKEFYLDRYLKESELEEGADRGVRLLDQVGTDLQLISPRPFTLMHSHPSVTDVRVWIELQNDLIARTVERHPTRFRGVAGLPQVAGQPIEVVFEELDRAVGELGFVGVVVNPDPYEGTGPSPRLSDPYWYPLWQRLEEMRVPAHIHSAACYGRETYDEHFASEESLAVTSLVHSEVFDRFPALEVMVSHGGGSIPYQIGRWRAHWWMDAAAKNKRIADYFRDAQQAEAAGQPLPSPPSELTSFDDALRRLNFDTDVHAAESLTLLFSVVGTDRTLFGTERPGSGSAINPATGRPLDDIRFTIESLDGLTEKDHALIFEDNARRVFPRLGEGA